MVLTVFVLSMPTSYISLLCESVYWSQDGFSNTSGYFNQGINWIIAFSTQKPSVSPISSSSASAEAAVVWLHPPTPTLLHLQLSQPHAELGWTGLNPPPYSIPHSLLCSVAVPESAPAPGTAASRALQSFRCSPRGEWTLPLPAMQPCLFPQTLFDCIRQAASGRQLLSLYAPWSSEWRIAFPSLPPCPVSGVDPKCPVNIQSLGDCSPNSGPYTC